MKKIFFFFSAVVCLWGCEKNEIFTPMTVTLASEGQTMTVETTIQPQTLDILDYDGNGMNMPEYDAETGTYTCSYLWLTASILSIFHQVNISSRAFCHSSGKAASYDNKPSMCLSSRLSSRKSYSSDKVFILVSSIYYIIDTIFAIFLIYKSLI